MKIGKVFLASVIALSTSIAAADQSLRTAQLKPGMWHGLQAGKRDSIIIEFREGDELPLYLNTQGDLFESKSNQPHFVTVKNKFWVKVKRDGYLFSRDGRAYQKLSDAVSGELAIGADAESSNAPANAINVAIKAVLKK